MGQSIVIDLKPEPSAPGTARAAMGELSDRLSGERLFSLKAVVSELVAKAVGRSEAIRLRVWRRNGEVWGEVVGTGGVKRLTVVESELLGQRIVDGFATQISHHDGASRVWFWLD
jgi:hypothetical protein